MFEYFKNLFTKKKRVFTDEEQTLYAGQKEQAIEQVLGKMHGTVGHAIIPFQIGGAVDMYYFPQHITGTGFATMELLEPDGGGSKPNRFGTYELVGFTRHPINMEKDLKTPFNDIERRVCGIFTGFEIILTRQYSIREKPAKCLYLILNTPVCCWINMQISL